MPESENRLIRRRLANAYISSVISISLVLFLIGVAALLIVNAGDVARYFKESMQVSVLLKQEAGDADAEAFRKKIEALPYIKSAEVISRERGTEELKAMLGEDFLSVFETSPVPLSVNVTLQAEYVSSDSLKVVVPALERFRIVDEVSCQQSLVDALNSNLKKISMVMGVFIALMLFISYVLINNTVRLSVFSRRFTIHTMKLVGATKAYICRPFVASAFWQGVVSSILASGVLVGSLYFLNRSFPALLEVFRKEMLLSVLGIIFACGIFICVTSTRFSVGRLVDWTRDELYY